MQLIPYFSKFLINSSNLGILSKITTEQNLKLRKLPWK
ncbi:MAG: hypothetical protein [Olavius algarvensis spirochete endosymbiont]|nr:MAG: hypothetical protein [Olavius algarvensis spirochete endosymbiont]